MNPLWLLVFLLVYFILGIGLNNLLKMAKRGSFAPSILIWPILLVIIAVHGEDTFDV
jgi:hypothetical protein